MKKTILTLILAVIAIAPLAAEGTGTGSQNRWQLLAGLSQPIIMHGGNVEINYLTKNWVFEYSHGFLLDLNVYSGFTKTAAERAQGLSITLPYSTGGGIGYRITEGFNVRAEFKVHRYEVSRGAESFAYTVYSAGVGAYYFWTPLGDHLVIVPSLRFWPNVATTLDSGKLIFADGQTHQAHDFGLFANISVGWRF